MKKMPHPNDKLSEAERRKRWMLRRATTAASNRCNAVGAPKVKGIAEVSLPSAESLKRILEEE